MAAVCVYMAERE